MAEIHVEPKKPGMNLSWIWILVVLVIIAAIAYFLLSNNAADENTTVQPGNTTSYIEQPHQLFTEAA